MTITIQTATESRTIHIPQSWNELSPTDAMTVLHLFQLDGPSLQAKKLSILAHLLGLTEGERRAWEKARKEEHGEGWRTVHAAELQQMLMTIDWLLEPVPGRKDNETGQYQLSPALTKCPFPHIDVPVSESAFLHRRKAAQQSGTEAGQTVRLYPPADGLKNLTGEELAHTFDTYEAYTQKPSRKNADKLIAMLFRPSKTETPELVAENYYGDRRTPLNLHTVEIRSRQLKSVLHPMARNLLLFWFLSCRMAIVRRWPVIFRSADDHQKEKDEFGWWGVYRAITGDVLKVDDLASKPYTDLFVELVYLESERKKREMEAALNS